MKRLNFNIKDRKILYMLLGIVLVSVFTLTVAYAALNAVLDISGSAQVSSAEWDVHFDNVKVTSGSVSGDDPVITSSTTATFSTILNLPGEFYEFSIDVVNDGSIDAMIENITKTPTLTSEQAKYLKYDITYQNGESITTKQLVEKNSFVRLKVRLEFRNDLSSSDLPTSSETLNLGLQLDYTQSDGSGSVVSANGRIMPVANGDINTIGTVVTIGTEQFHVIGSDENNVKLFAMYNLYVGNVCTSFDVCTPIENPTGLQHYTATTGSYPNIAALKYSDEPLQTAEGSYVQNYINEYADYFVRNGISVVEARSINYDELISSGCEEEFNYSSNLGPDWQNCYNAPEWLLKTSFWTNESYNGEIMVVQTDGNFFYGFYDNISSFGVRPVIVISKDYFS